MSKVRCQFFQCCIETLGSTSVKSGLCPSINITTVKSSSATFYRQTDCVAREKQIQGRIQLQFKLLPKSNQRERSKVERSGKKLTIRSPAPTKTVK